MIWWKIYFWAFLVLSIIGSFALFQYLPFGLVDVLAILLNIILLLTLYSYILEKKVLSVNNWKILLWVMVVLLIEELVELFIFPDLLSKVFPLLDSNIPSTTENRLLGVLISLPAIYAAYKLSLKSSK